MSTLPAASALEILDLRHFSARQLRPLLEEEARAWQTRLRWDYSSSIELLLQYLESRVLQGFVATLHGHIRGYTFCVYEGNKAVIGDLFATGLGAASDHETAATLLVHILDLLRNSPMVDRIEAQLLLSDSGEFASLFTDPGFRSYPRLFLECDLTRPFAAPPAAPPLPSGLTLAPWAPQDYQSAGELIHDAYAGHTDALINDQYRTLHGALRFLHNIVRFPGCGIFEPELSFTLRETHSRSLLGLVLVSRVAPDVAHITQFCIAPSRRHQRLGLTLLRHTVDILRRHGFRAITLTVTEANTPAVDIYNAFGFHPRHRFDAIVLDHPTQPRRRTLI